MDAAARMLDAPCLESRRRAVLGLLECMGALRCADLIYLLAAVNPLGPICLLAAVSDAVPPVQPYTDATAQCIILRSMVCSVAMCARGRAHAHLGIHRCGRQPPRYVKPPSLRRELALELR